MNINTPDYQGEIPVRNVTPRRIRPILGGITTYYVSGLFTTRFIGIIHYKIKVLKILELE